MKEKARTYGDSKNKRAPVIRIKFVLDCSSFSFLDREVAVEEQKSHLHKSVVNCLISLTIC